MTDEERGWHLSEMKRLRHLMDIGWYVYCGFMVILAITALFVNVIYPYSHAK